MPPAYIIPIFWLFNSASEVTYIVSGGALNSTHSFWLFKPGNPARLVL